MLRVCIQHRNVDNDSSRAIFDVNSVISESGQAARLCTDTTIEMNNRLGDLPDWAHDGGEDEGEKDFGEDSRPTLPDSSAKVRKASLERTLETVDLKRALVIRTRADPGERLW